MPNPPRRGYTDGMINISLLGMGSVSYGDVDFKDVEALGNTAYADPKTPDEIVRACESADAVLVNKTLLDGPVLSRLPRLRYIGILATGYNNVDLAACRKYGITCTNVPGYSTDAVAQHTVGLMLCAAGSLPQYLSSVQSGDWIRAPRFSYYAYPMHEVAGKTLGIYGYGNIGRRVAKIADALGMRVIFCTRGKKSGEPYEQVDRETLLRQSDFLTLHCPLTEETAGLIGKDALRLMKPSAVLINAARGGLVDEQALADALNSGRLAAACVDVLRTEPMLESCPLRSAKNCYITPHAAWLPQETRQKLEILAAENLEKFLAGTPQNVVS